MLQSLDPSEDPFALFSRWYDEATKSEPSDPNAIALATVGADGMPAVRMVLLKDFGAEGFTFFTNYESRKADHLTDHPRAAFCLHWKSLYRQIRVEGEVSRVSAAESDAYFATRPWKSQVGAWASLQSRPLPDWQTFMKRIAGVSAQYATNVPRPPHWGGFRLRPSMIEFWQGHENRWHDRMVYTRQGDASWTALKLYP
ncbi:MAG: pyridoxamine 5'-phosphate oxidase [Alphaproteobacteria bacterium]